MTTMQLVRLHGLEARYEFVKLVRLPAYAIPTLLFPVMFYVLFGLVFGGRVGSLTMATYLIASYGAFGVIGAALFGFGVGVAMERGQGWLQLKRATPMPISAYFGAKVGMSLLFSVAIVALLLAIGMTFGNVRLTSREVVLLSTVLIAGALPFCALGLAIGYMVGPNSAPAVINLLYLPVAFASGLWIPIEALPGVVQAVALALPPYHYNQVALAAIGGGRGPVVAHLVFLAGFTILALTAAVWAYHRDEGRTYG